MSRRKRDYKCLASVNATPELDVFLGGFGGPMPRNAGLDASVTHNEVKAQQNLFTSQTSLIP